MIIEPKTINIGYDTKVYLPFKFDDKWVVLTTDKEESMELLFKDNEPPKVKIHGMWFNDSDLYFDSDECQLACDRLNGISHD